MYGRTSYHSTTEKLTMDFTLGTPIRSDLGWVACLCKHDSFLWKHDSSLVVGISADYRA